MVSKEPSFVSVAGVEENSGELDSSDEDIELQRGVDEHFRFCVNKHSWPSPRVKHRTTSSLIAILHCSCFSKRKFLFETYHNTTVKEPEHAIEKRCIESISEHFFIVWTLKWAWKSDFERNAQSIKTENFEHHVDRPTHDRMLGHHRKVYTVVYGMCLMLLHPLLCQSRPDNDLGN